VFGECNREHGHAMHTRQLRPSSSSQGIGIVSGKSNANAKANTAARSASKSGL